MSEQLAPRVTVTLPGGSIARGHLHSRRQDTQGRWWYEVSLTMPAAAVHPQEGEDYSTVPTERADSPAWVFQALPNDAPKQRSVILHRGGCWAGQGRLTSANDTQARIFLREGWATACDVCHPAPGTGTEDS
ncbi:DUF6233 domain-containing protein [Streptomyces sp. NPDC006332]|uniref:DUF6233 domain-containing protein n=1 Tax=Streptomyces sp. NPDC006332 TaxID=3155456 RepID=UPI0033B129FD